MRILIFLYEIDSIGGTEIATRQLAEQLSIRGHEVVLLGTQAMSRFLRRTPIIETINQLKIIRLPVWQRSQTIFRRMLLIEALFAIPLLAWGFDILITRGVNRNSANIARIAKSCGMRTVCIVMGSGKYGDFGIKPIGLQATDVSFDTIVALTQDCQDEVLEWGYSSEKIKVINNGVNTKLFYPKNSVRNKKGVLFVGRFREQKRIDLLLQAWAVISKTNPDYQLTLVGGGDQQPDYEKMAKELQINVTFLPASPRHVVIELLQRNTFFVLPSASEGMSNALLEAMACGLVPIASNIPGNRAVITHEFNGILFDPGPVDSLVEAFTFAFNHPEQCELIAHNALSTITQLYSLDRIVEQYETLMKQLVKS